MTTDVAQLFARDPLKHTDEDITAIIERFRAARSQFNNPTATPAKAKAKAEKPLDPKLAGLDLDLGDL